MSYRVTLGLEEEVFVLERGRLTPTLQSLDTMRRLLWSNPRRYMVRSASNFARGEDQKQCFMSSVEVSTGVHGSADALVQDLVGLRTEFARAAKGALVVPVGSLFTLEAPTNTAGLHIHVGCPSTERSRIYDNLAYFLPALAVASASSPFAGGKPFGLSYRMAQPHALGPLRADREYRFQDIIVTKRLGTVEVRLLDPMPEIDRLRDVVRAVEAIANYTGRLPFDRDEYNRERPNWTKHGLTPWVKTRLDELQQIYPLDARWLESTFGGRLAVLAEAEGVLGAYEEADRTWRACTNIELQARDFSPVRAARGVAGFYAVRLPYMAYKGIREWKGKAK
jgi:gamma-glutamyl:cysteine ligase YbdK (ATP-grasp superfamily)